METDFQDPPDEGEAGVRWVVFVGVEKGGAAQAPPSLDEAPAAPATPAALPAPAAAHAKHHKSQGYTEVPGRKRKGRQCAKK